MPVDVSAEIEIAAAPTAVAAIMFDPARASEWMAAISAVEVIDPALVRGARVRHRGSVLHYDFEWTTEVEAVHFPHLLALRTSDGPLVGTTRFDIQRSAGGSRVRIRSVGELGAGLSAVPTALVAAPLQSAVAADLERLKALVEA